MTFKVGDIVELRSGGPLMTVYGRDIGQVGCIWFDDTGDGPFEGWMPPEVLDLVEPLEIVDDEDGFYEDLIEHELSDGELEVLVAQSNYYKNGH